MSVAGSGEHSGIFRITKERLKESDNGVGYMSSTNAAFTASINDLPQAVFQGVDNKSATGTVIETSTNNGLGLSGSNEEVTSDEDISRDNETGGSSKPKCQYHTGRSAILLCVDCLCYVCAKCHRIHHSLHKTASCDSLNQKSSGVSEVYAKCTKLAEKYHESLEKELVSLDITLSDAVTAVERVFEDVLARINTQKQEAILKIEGKIAFQRQTIIERLELNEQMISQYKDIVDGDSWTPELSDGKWTSSPRRLFSVPKTTLSVEIDVDGLTLPDIDIQLKTVATPVPMDDVQCVDKLSVNTINTVGCKGDKELEFRLPGGVCMDRENNLYVADEGNNRIQWISKEGVALGTFTWEQKNYFITDVTYDASCDRLIVPRAYSELGLLRCSTFSYVSLSGSEMSRFVVPGMQGGLFVHCGDDGDILISDVVKKSVFVIRGGNVYLEINDDEHLKQPAHCTFGREGEILVVDSARRVVAVFDHNGLHIRDIGIGEGRDVSDLQKPSGISIDKSCGIVAVTDWCADKVLLFSYQGALLSTVNGFKCPHSISINDNHRMVVTDCWNNQLKVFSYSSEQTSA